MKTPALVLYCLIAAAVVSFQLALVAGAPWGRLTQGGRHEGALPASGRVIAALSVVVLGFMTAGVASAVGHFPHWAGWTGYAALGAQGLSTLANWATPSRPERMLWGPINTLLFGLAAYAVLY